MKLKYEFLIREIMDEYVVVPMGESALLFSGMITTNAVGACLWKELEQETTQQALVSRLTEEFAVDEARAKEDVEKFLDGLRELQLLEESL